MNDVTLGLADWLLRRTLPRGEAGDTIHGDLIEELEGAGRTRTARRRYLRHACSLALRYGLERPRSNTLVNPSTGGRPMWGSIGYDIRFAMRSLALRPMFTLMTLATLGLGMGAATAIFSIVNGILLRPLPFVQPERLVAVNETDGGERMTFAMPNYVDVHRRATSFEAMACYQSNAFNVIDGRPRRIDGRLVCASFFDVLGVRMQLGRTFTTADDRAGAAPVAIISDRFWKQDLGGDPSVLGRTIRTTEMPFTIVGVLPPDYRFARPEHIYAPIGLTVTADSGWLDRGNHFGLYAVARLKAGVSLDQARGELDRIAADLRRAYPNTNARSGAQIVPLRDRIVGPLKGTLVALMGAVSCLLLLACVNVANLFVVRGAARQHELAIRSAIGGSRWRLVRQLLTESTLLAAAGAAFGVAVAWLLLEVLLALAPAGIPRVDQVGLDAVSLAFAAGAALACGLVFGAFPAFQASGVRGQQLAIRSGRTSGAVSRRSTRAALMVIEVALALILLAGCGLMMRTMARLNSVEPGFRAERLLTARVTLSGTAWDDRGRRRVFYRDVLDRVRRVPGVTGAALTLSVPIEGSQWGSVFVARDKPAPARADLPSAAFVPISAGYVETMGIAMRAGRSFDARDGAEAEKVIIVNETLARRLWPGENPLGKQLKQGWPETPEKYSPWREVVGVVADVKLDGVDQDTPMQVFLPIEQEPARSVALVVRTSGDPASVARPVEAAVQALIPALPITGIVPMTQLMSDAVARQRVSTVVLAMFSVIAMLLAAVGLYGVVSHSVTERTREIGVRMALGADGRKVVRMFVSQGLLTAGAGVAIGLPAAVVLARSLESLLFGVPPSDPATLVAVAGVLLATASIACYLPARRASHIDPLGALRAE